MAVYSSFDQTTLDREYSPSQCVDDIKVCLDEYARTSRKAREAAIAQKSCLIDLAYGADENERLDLFLPAPAIRAPLQVYIHGGYWQTLGKNDSSFAATNFQQQGSFFAALNYSLAPATSLTEIVAQCRCAIAWLYRNASQRGFDRDRIYLSGSSAGAHIAMMMLLTDWAQYGLPDNALKGVCAVSGIYDLEPIRLSYVNEILGMSPGEARANSPMQQPLRNHCPIILAYGDNETSEFKRQTDEYKTFLLQEGEHVRSREIQGRNHFDVIMDLANPDTWMCQQVFAQMGLN